MNRILIILTIMLSFSAQAQQLKTVTTTDASGQPAGGQFNAAIIQFYKSNRVEKLVAPDGEVLTGQVGSLNFEELKPFWVEFYESGVVRTIMAPSGKSLGGKLLDLDFIAHNVNYVSVYLRKDGNGYIGYIKAPKGQFLKGTYRGRNFDAEQINSTLFTESIY